MWIVQEAVARAQRAFQCVDARAVLGVGRQHQAIQELAALRRGAGKQAIHRRHQPEDAQMIGERGRRHRFAVDAAFARDVLVIRRRFDAGAQHGDAKAAFDFRRYRPRSVALAESHFFHRRVAQAAAGAEDGDRFQHVGLAGAVRANQHDRSIADVDACRVVAAEVGQGQAADACGSGQADVQTALCESSDNPHGENYNVTAGSKTFVRGFQRAATASMSCCAVPSASV